MNRSLHSNRSIVLIKAICFFLLAPVTSFCQDLLVQNKTTGFNISANFALGSHFQRIGFNFNFFYASGHFQANTQLRTYMSFKNLGPGFIYPELVLSQGFVVSYGAKQNFYNPFLNSVSNQTGYSSSAAYSYNVYLNAKKTSQQTGLLAFQFNRISIITENDILARTYYDRFRTGAFLIQYQYDDKFQAAVNCSLWTGEMGRKMQGSGGCSWPCYMDTVRGSYTGYSHGLLSAQFKYNIGISQNIQANVGVDAEQVRNAVQNKLIHDLVFIPRKWIRPKNCHIPMLDSQGGQYRCEPGQQIKKPELYWNVFSNANVFY